MDCIDSLVELIELISSECGYEICILDQQDYKKLVKEYGRVFKKCPITAQPDLLVRRHRRCSEKCVVAEAKLCIKKITNICKHLSKAISQVKNVPGDLEKCYKVIILPQNLCKRISIANSRRRQCWIETKGVKIICVKPGHEMCKELFL